MFKSIDSHDHFDTYEKHMLGQSIYKTRNYDQLKKEFDRLFSKNYAFFTQAKLSELSETCDVKLVARGHMTIELDKHDRPVYSSKTFLESQDFTGPESEVASNAILVTVLIILFLLLIAVFGFLFFEQTKQFLFSKDRNTKTSHGLCDRIGKCIKKSNKKAKKVLKKKLKKELRKKHKKHRKQGTSLSNDETVIAPKEQKKVKQSRRKSKDNLGKYEKVLGFTQSDSSDDHLYMNINGLMSNQDKDENDIKTPSNEDQDTSTVKNESSQPQKSSTSSRRLQNDLDELLSKKSSASMVGAFSDYMDSPLNLVTVENQSEDPDTVPRAVGNQSEDQDASPQTIENQPEAKNTLPQEVEISDSPTLHEGEKHEDDQTLSVRASPELKESIATMNTSIDQEVSSHKSLVAAENQTESTPLETSSNAQPEHSDEANLDATTEATHNLDEHDSKSEESNKQNKITTSEETLQEKEHSDSEGTKNSNEERQTRDEQ